MIPHIVILPLGPHSFAAFIDHGRGTTYHQVTLAPDFLLKAGLASAAEEVVAHEALAYLLRARGPAHVPAMLRLTTPFRTDPQLLPELRARLA